VTCKGIGSNGHKYMGAYDSARFKTFRIDRILRIERVPPAGPSVAESTDHDPVLKA